MHVNRIWRLFIPLVLLGMMLSGCVIKQPDQLYAIPKQPASYENLQATVDGVLTGDISYCAPTAGENRQPIQMQDLDGDGKNEAIVFAKGTGEQPLKIYIFSSNGSEQYTLLSTLECEGASFETVCYAQIDGSPGAELIIGCRIGDQMVRSITVYTLENQMSVKLLSTVYNAYTTTDLNGDGRTDLLLVRNNVETESYLMEYYSYSEGALIRNAELPLSECSTLKRMITGFSDANHPAVFVAAETEDGILNTDVFTIVNGTFTNIAKDTDSTTVTARSYSVYATDIDNDGIIELPDVQLQQNSADFQIIQWYNLAESGRKVNKLLTFHDFSRGFYLVLNDDLRTGLEIVPEVESGLGTVYCFFKGETGDSENCLFTLYFLEGSDRETLASSDGRFSVYENNAVCISVELGAAAGKYGITEQKIIDAFRLIHTDWNSGEM